MVLCLSLFLNQVFAVKVSSCTHFLRLKIKSLDCVHRQIPIRVGVGSNTVRKNRPTPKTFSGVRLPL